MTQLDHAPTTVSSPEEAVVGVHLGHLRERDAEHTGIDLARALAARGIAVTWLATHRTVTPARPAVSLSFTAAVDEGLFGQYLAAAVRESAVSTADSDAEKRARAAAEAARTRTEGRLVWFPGHTTVGDTATVGDLLTATAVEEISTLGGGDAVAERVVLTRSFVRPRFERGQVVLHVQPARGNTLIPFEIPDPTPCCVDHA